MNEPLAQARLVEARLQARRESAEARLLIGAKKFRDLMSRNSLREEKRREVKGKIHSAGKNAALALANLVIKQKK